MLKFVLEQELTSDPKDTLHSKEQTNDESHSVQISKEEIAAWWREYYNL